MSCVFPQPAALCDFAPLQDDDLVGSDNRRKAMGDDQCRAVLRHDVER